jgi:type II secretory pathway component PulF
MSSAPHSIFYRQLATMLDAGVPVYQALVVLSEQRQPYRFRRSLQAMSAAVIAGNSLGHAMTASPHDFTPFHRAMIAAGEKSGTLVPALRRIAEHLEEAHALRSQIKRELFYSQLTMGLALLFWPGVLYGLQNSPPALILIGILPLCLFSILLLLGAMIPRLSGQTMPWVDHVLARIPVLGKTAALIGQTQFARNLSFLSHAGISLPEAVRWAGDSSGNACLAIPLRACAQRLESGEELATSLNATGVLDPILITMLQTGELTGDLESVLDKAAEYFQGTTDTTLHRLKVNLGVAALLNAGLCVGIILVRFYT